MNTIETQNSKKISYPKPLDLTVRPVVQRSKCSTRKLNYFLDIMLKGFMMEVPII